MPRHHRHNSDRRSAQAHAGLSSVAYTSRGPAEEGRHETTWDGYTRRFRDLYRKGGHVFSGSGETEEEARREAEATAAELLAKWAARAA
jgi:hypothetical protein